MARLIVIVLLMTACSGGKKSVVVEEAPIKKEVPAGTPVRLEVALAPQLTEVHDAIKRVFKDAAVLDPNYKPNFLAGDFNGDNSQDLAVILRPAPDKLSEINQEYPPWLLRDPRSNGTPRPLRIEQDEPLLAVIHGHGTNDWRDPDATQTFVLKNAVGSDLRVHTGKEFVSANTGRRIPRPQGDLIGETLNGTSGYLYYATSTYAWYDPKTFKGNAQPGIFHKPKPMRAHVEKPRYAHAQQAPAPIAWITAEELKAKLAGNSPVAIIDVRGSEGYAASSTTIKGAMHFKLRRLESRLKFAPLKNVPKDREVVTYCACPADESSIKAAEILQAAGFRRVRVLKGGWREWNKANGPVQPK